MINNHSQALHKHENHSTIILWTCNSISQLFMTFQNMLTKPRRTYQNPQRAQVKSYEQQSPTK
ncbi:hypothetical protein CDL12_22604 [Handroanthus impetiginosus]|uniref:Uncharacterized protein n=1 Tax=Handroanthus impetiginosus TaxID=429701 RepID=A0A2G9G9U7_9LAMI|nr:hypothetical protein CDL12_25409 [Handroanthus impetiginosus]PIN04861.1 hypothetical protein CDL12_22604 [Handroanthus impetiginosus]